MDAATPAPRIVIEYDAVDGVHSRGEFSNLRNARAYAQRMVGKTPELGRWYAVSSDGIGRISLVYGCTLAELFPDLGEDGD